MSAEAFSIRATGIKGSLWSAGSILTGGNQFFRLFIFPFLLTLLYVAAIRLKAGDFRSSSPERLRKSSVLAHLACLAAFVLLTAFLAGRQAPQGSALLPAIWFALGIATAVSGILTVFDHSAISRSTRGAVLLVAAFTIFSLAGIPAVERLWNHDSNITVRASTALLQHMGFDARSEGKRIRIPHFAVIITPACSGYEGIGLFLLFATAWLVWFRKEYRFPYALLVLPVGAVLSWGLNVMRIAAYVLIGHYGHRDIAMSGFHSWAGLISLTILILGFCVLTPRVPVISALPAQPRPKPAEQVTDPIFWYLMPFLAMQAASMISRAASAGMEWLYPLRVIAAGVAIWGYRKKYRSMEWGRPSAIAATIGLAAAILWTASMWRLPFNAGPGAHLQGVPAVWRYGWLTFRVFGGVLLAPFGEELAFRGFLMRRISAVDFASAEAHKCGWLAVAVSAIVFGSLHGSRWIAGTIAGVLYGYAYERSGKLSDAVVAHTCTNGILAVLVAATGDWRYW